MTPTNKLRFVEREKVNVDLFCNTSYQKIHVLQQWWETDKSNVPQSMHELIAKGKWRDVPVEVEA